MAIIYEEALKNEIKKDRATVYILFGEDGYLKKLYMQKISRACAEEDDIFNYQKFSADCDLQEVYDAVLQFPMMSDKKCVILTDYDFEHCAKSDLDKLCTVISDTPDTCVFILWFDSLEFDHKKNNKFKSLTNAVDKANGVTAMLNHRSLPELVKMLTDGANKRGCKFESNAARYLVEMSGDDISTLKNELDKLCGFVKSGEITKQTVQKVCTKTVEASVYDLSRQIIDCNLSAALNTLDELFFLKVEPIIILSTVSAYYVDMYRVFAGKANGAAIGEIAAVFGYKNREFVLKKASADLKKFDAKKFNLSFEALRNADKFLKSFSSDPRTVLEQLAVNLSYIAAKGESLD